jgi:hypothetical protein
MTDGDDAADHEISNAQRTFWMALFYLLIMPFFGAIAGVALLALALAFGMPPEPFTGKAFADVAPQFGRIFTVAFIWSVIPSAFTMLGLVPFVLKSGTTTVFMAGAIGVIAFTFAIVIFPFDTAGFQPLVAFIAGLISVACQQVLRRGGILKSPVAE